MKASFTLILVGVAALLGAVGCGNDIKDYCDKKVSCEGGNDKDKSACTDLYENEEDRAEDYDCGDSFSKFKDCIVSNSSCQTAADGTKYYTTYTSATAAGTDKCAAQYSADTAPTNGAPLFVVCKDAASARPASMGAAFH